MLSRVTHDVTLYTRRNCQLCDDAKLVIESARLPIAFTIVDIDDDPQLQARFTNDVPVIFIDGAEAFRHRVTAEQLAAHLAGARSPLTSETCVPCRGGVAPMLGEEVEQLASTLGGGWRVVDEHHLQKEFTFADFAEALAFTNRVGAIAESQGHHPDLQLSWGKVGVSIWTHKAGGLTRADFVLAAKIDAG
jgi:4a-hydroxytetrahydrobiopterin dehydratase